MVKNLKENVKPAFVSVFILVWAMAGEWMIVPSAQRELLHVDEVIKERIKKNESKGDWRKRVERV